MIFDLVRGYAQLVFSITDLSMTKTRELALGMATQMATLAGLAVPPVARQPGDALQHAIGTGGEQKVRTLAPVAPPDRRELPGRVTELARQPVPAARVPQPAAAGTARSRPSSPAPPAPRAPADASPHPVGATAEPSDGPVAEVDLTDGPVAEVDLTDGPVAEVDLTDGPVAEVDLTDVSQPTSVDRAPRDTPATRSAQGLAGTSRRAGNRTGSAAASAAAESIGKAGRPARSGRTVRTSKSPAVRTTRTRRSAPPGGQRSDALPTSADDAPEVADDVRANGATSRTRRRPKTAPKTAPVPPAEGTSGAAAADSPPAGAGQAEDDRS